MAEALEAVAAGLPDEQRAEFFKTVHEAGIGRHDLELAKLLRALQLHKAYYESIPASVKEAVAQVAQLKGEIAKLAGQAAQDADAGSQTLDQLAQETAQICESLKKLHSHVEDAVDKASAIVSKRMKELLSAAMEEALPLSDLGEAGKVFSETVAAGRKASAELKANVRFVRRAHLRAYAIAAAAATAGLWASLCAFNELRLERARVAVVTQYEGNRDALIQLGKSNRRLELRGDPKKPGRKFLSMRDATGWTSTDRRGVIEFEE